MSVKRVNICQMHNKFTEFDSENRWGQHQRTRIEHMHILVAHLLNFVCI